MFVIIIMIIMLSYLYQMNHNLVLFLLQRVYTLTNISNFDTNNKTE